MLKVVDVVYHCHHEYNRPQQVLEKHFPTIGFAEFLHTDISFELVRHLDYEGKQKINGFSCACFRRSNTSWNIPFSTHRYIRSLDPDIVLVHGFVFPLQVMALRRSLGKKPVIILQHHGDKPANSVRKYFQKIADRFVDAYIFTAAGIAEPWLRHGIIHDKSEIVEILQASSAVEKKDKNKCRQKLRLNGSYNFLWVGRLNENKDPFTIFKAFAGYVLLNPAARLYLVYQSDELLSSLRSFIADNSHLKDHIVFIGGKSQAELADWYNAADFFILGSHEEGAGYALMEAMSVGCIPVVTSIPSFKKITGNGSAALLFPVAEPDALLRVLQSTQYMDIPAKAASIEKYFHDHLGFKHVADKMSELFYELVSVKR